MTATLALPYLVFGLIASISLLLVAAVRLHEQRRQIRYYRERATAFWRGWSVTDADRKAALAELRRIKRDNPWAS